MKELYFATYAQALDALCEHLAHVKEDLDTEHVVLVPDVYTFALEKRLYLSGKGSFSIIVRSFSRLFNDYCDAGSVLPKNGAVLLVKKIAFEHKDELTCFKYSYKKGGFAEKTYETISRLREQGVKPSSMSAKSMKKNKINDVRLIYSKYLEETQGKFVDSVGKNERLIEYFNALKSKQKRHYYVVNFDVINKSTARLLEAMDGKCESLTVYKSELAPIKSNVKSLVVYKAQNDADQLKETARLITAQLKKGYKADDICVVTENANYERITRIFADFALPVFVDKKIPLSSHPLYAFVAGALEVWRRGIKREDMIALCKNACFDATRAERDDFCTYANKYLISYKGFLQPFDKIECAQLANAEKTRVKLAQIINSVSFTSSKISAADFCNAVKGLLSFAKRSENDGVVDWDKANVQMESALNVTVKVLGRSEWDVEFLISSFEEACKAVSFSVVPRSVGAVKVGGLNDFRGQKFGSVYLLSFNEGVAPKHQDDCGLLTDSDLFEMEECGEGEFEFEAKVDVLNRRYRDELWQLLQADCSLFAAYVSTEKDKPSYDLSLLINEKKVKEYSREDYEDALKNCEDDAEFARLLAGEENAIEQLFSVEPSKKFSALYKAVEERVKNYGKTKSGVVAKEYVELETTSVSALQAYASCPFKYFCQYVLRLNPIEDGSITPLDVGNILHETAEEYLQAKVKDPADKVILQIVEQKIEKNAKASLEANRAICERLKTEAVKLCAIARNQVEKSQYRLLGSEMSFGYDKSRKGKAPLKSITFDGGGKEVTLVGSIDRVDVWTNTESGECYGRVIDYKTGYVKGFDYADLYYGEKLQLPLYASVLEQNGYKTGGFFYFPFSVKWSDNDDANKLLGAYDNDSENVIALSTPEDPFAADKGISAGALKAVRDYAYDFAQRVVDGIVGGNIAPNPTGGYKRTACDHCEYAGVCGFDQENGRKRERRYSDAICRSYVHKKGEVEL